MRCKHQIIITRLNGEIANGDCGKMATFKLRPVFSTIDRNPKSEFGPKKEKVWLDQIFFDNSDISTNAFGVLGAGKRRPRLTVIGCFKNIRRHIAKSMSIERRVCRARVEVARLHPADP